MAMHNNSTLHNNSLKSSCQAFQSLFKGREDAWGSVEGKYNPEPVTIQHYSKHLEGKKSLGIYFVLDNHTCHFAAIDVDDFSFSKAVAVRNALKSTGIPAYIAASKSNHFHVYLFAEDRFIAKDIRRILKHIVKELGIKTDKGRDLEIFPKQDKHEPDDPPSEKYPNGRRKPGSYINLPYYGATRKFLAVSKEDGSPKEVPLETLVKQIKRTPNEVIAKILKELPETKEPPAKTRKPKGGQKRRPPCIAIILKGTSEGQRDEAAFALANHYISELKYLPEEVFGLLQAWDKKNNPPLNDDHLLQAKAYGAAEKGYPFGCSSIIKNDLLKEFCVGEDDCEWLKEVTKKRKLYDNLPEIKVNNRYLKEKTEDTIAAVEIANNPPRIFERSGHMVRIEHDEDMIPFIEQMSESAFRGFIERCANFFQTHGKVGEFYDVPVDPPMEIVKDIMSLPERNLQPLLSITEIPILRPDGSVLKEPGYDPITRIYYEPAKELKIPPISDEPSQKELEAAVTLLEELFVNFPFDNEASKTNAIACLLTPIYRPMISGVVPLCIFDKPQPGTGASLASAVISIIATGRTPGMMPPPKRDEEWDKRILAILLRGHSVMVIDNVEGILFSPSLAALLTSDTYQGRILGRSENVSLPNRGTYIATGNNIKLAGDLPRRCYLSRMDAKEARPWMRDTSKFKHPKLLKWVSKERGRLISAALTLARSWIVAGKPQAGGLPTLGGFEDWVDIIGNILGHAEISGFLQNLEIVYSRSDTEATQWEDFLEEWRKVFGSEAVRGSNIIGKLNENGELMATLPDLLAESFDKKGIVNRLGKALARRESMRFANGFMIIRGSRIEHHAVTWRVIDYRNEKEMESYYKEQEQEQKEKARREQKEKQKEQYEQPDMEF